tara:strand:+ start:633 stop:1097 length:465 start_codon:yes stop_codon:yes gene_type:complete
MGSIVLSLEAQDVHARLVSLNAFHNELFMEDAFVLARPRITNEHNGVLALPNTRGSARIARPHAVALSLHPADVLNVGVASWAIASSVSSKDPLAVVSPVFAWWLARPKALPLLCRLWQVAVPGERHVGDVGACVVHHDRNFILAEILAPQLDP